MKFLSKKNFAKIIKISSVILFIGCVLFLIYYLILQPYYSKKVTEQYRDLYYSYSEDSENLQNNMVEPETEDISISLDKSQKQNAKDSTGKLLKFSKLLEYNSDIKGWLSIPGTGIDYPVMQDIDGGDFYLNHDFEGTIDKNGCLYIDGNCNVEEPTKNIVIHGHNMDSTKMMFYELLNYNDVDYYKEHPVITFDSIYRNSQWKIISFIRVAGQVSRNDGFNYMQGTFESDEEFLDFLYQIESRSLYYCPVNVNENDSLLMLSTCSYEVNDYRTVVVARRVRKGETTDVDVDKAYVRSDVLLTDAYYKVYGGEKPTITNFEDAYSFGEIKWYDGDVRRTNSIGEIVEVDKLKYKIISADNVEFIGCSNTNIKELDIPSTVEINDREFQVTEYDKTAFDKLTKLKSLKTGNNITDIPSHLFEKCKKLQSVIIGDNVKTIGKKAFYKLDKLTKIKLRSLELETIAESAFKGISPKAKFKLPKKKSTYYTKLLKSSGIPEDAKIKTY